MAKPTNHAHGQGGSQPSQRFQLSAASITQLRTRSGARPREQAGYTDFSAEVADPLVDLLRRAVVRDELVLTYQPFIEARSQRLIGAEALVHWESPDLGNLPPGSVIPLAEHCGLIMPTTLWLLNQALGQCQAWQLAGSPLRISVKLSPLCLQDPVFARRVAAILRCWDVQPSSLMLELIESEGPEDADSTLRAVERLRAIGVRVALDRFGRSHSSLERLRLLPVDSIKLCRSFVQSYTESARSRAIVDGLLTMTRSLGYEAIATGIETQDALASLTQAGFDLLQGDGIGGPLTADAFGARWLAAQA